jgi:hypothetical protein
MPQEPNHREPKKNRTYEKLRASPFKSADELALEEEKIRLETWRRLTEARIFDELLTKPENDFVKRIWKAGVRTRFGGTGEDICHVFADEDGVKMTVNKAVYDSLPSHEVQFIEGVLRATLEGFEASHMRVRGLSKSDRASSDDRASKPIPSKPKPTGNRES